MKRAAGVISVAIGLQLACNHSSPTSPSKGPGTALSLAIVGNTSLKAVNETSQLAAMVRFADGTTKDLTSVTRWDTDDHAVAAVSPSGLLKAIALGKTILSAAYGNLDAYLPVRVLPDGTFIVQGSVTEPGLPELPLVAATVSLTQGSDASASTVTTKSDGSYAFDGVAGNVTIQATHDGYVTQTQSMIVTQDQILSFTLQPVVPPAQIAGSYTLTLTAAPTCTGLPIDAVQRTYTATLSEDGAGVSVVLSGANFFTYPNSGPSNSFSGRVSGNLVTFTISYDGYYDVYDVVESLGGTRYLTISGSATTTLTPSGLSGTLTGPLSVVDVSGYFWQKSVLAVCTGEHGFVLAKAATTSRRTRR